MAKRFLLLFAVVMLPTFAFGQKTQPAKSNDAAKTQPREFTHEYEYIADENDGSVSASENATEQIRAILLREIAEAVIAEQKKGSASSGNRFIYDNYSEKITAIAASIAKMEILSGNRTGAKYYVRAKIAIDPSEVSKIADEILLNHKEMKALHEKNREISRRVENLNGEMSKLKAKRHDDENFSFAEIREYKTKANDYLSRIIQLNEEIENYKREVSFKDSVINSDKSALAKMDSTIKSLNSQIADLRNAQKQNASSYGAAKTVKGIECVLVKAGTFIMGSPAGESGHKDDEIRRQVTLTNDYYIGKYEVTNAQYAEFLNSKKIGADGSWNGNIWVVGDPCGVQYSNGKWKTANGYDNYPIIMVTWYGANEFCKWAGGRLPTEAQWEYAARGGNKSLGNIYSGSGSIDRVAWYDGNSASQTHPVGTKSPNELGIYDMSGNVWEWCGDWYGSYDSSSVVNPVGSGSGSYRVIRGGSWLGNALYCRIAERYYYSPSIRHGNLGLRVVFDVR